MRELSENKSIDFGISNSELEELRLSSKTSVCEGGSEGGAG